MRCVYRASTLYINPEIITESVTVIDTLNMILRMSIPDMEAVCKNLHNCRPKTFRDGLNGYEGYLKSWHNTKNQDLKVQITNYYVKVGFVSWCKWFYGDNFHTMTLSDIRQCIERISEQLGLPMGEARITRLDIGHNIIVDHKPEIYLNHLGTLLHHKRLPTSEGALYYSNSLRQFVLYDKKKAPKHKRDIVPTEYINSHVLRLELRLLRKLASNFTTKVITADMLCEEKFYHACIKLWGQYYWKIQKINNIGGCICSIKTKTALYNHAIVSLAEQFGGQLQLIEIFEESQVKKIITSKQKSDLKEAVINACNSPTLRQPSELITELDRKVIEATDFLHNHSF